MLKHTSVKINITEITKLTEVLKQYQASEVAPNRSVTKPFGDIYCRMQKRV